MKNLFRSFRYLRPYRFRLGVAVVCALLIGVLWGGGLAMVMPGSKVLLSDEGFLGWAYNSVTEDRLGIKLAVRVPTRQVDGVGPAMVTDVIAINDDSPAVEVLKTGQWIVGIDDGVTEQPLLGGDELNTAIAHASPGVGIRLRVYDPESQRAIWTDEFVLADPGWQSAALGWVASVMPLDRFGQLLVLLALTLGITLARDVLRFSQEYLVQSAVYCGLMDLRCDNYNVVLHLPTTFFSEKGITDSMSRFLQDVNELRRAQITLFGKTLVEPCKAIGAITLALMVSWKLTVLTMVVGPPVFLLIQKFGKVMKKASRRALEGWATMLGVLEETLSGIRVVKAYTMEGAERKRFFRVNRALLKQQRRMARIDSATAPTVEAIGWLAATGVLALAGYFVLKSDKMPTGGFWALDMNRDKFFLLMAALVAMFDPVRKLAHVSTRFHRADAAAIRIFQLHDTEQEKRVPNAPMLPRHSDSIEFRNVTFHYPSAAVCALKNINLTIRAGETIALVGPNGSGKTTLMSLVPRLLDPTGGAVLIDGKDIASCSLRSLRKQIGLVTQETVIFNASIGENISYGLRRPSPADVLDAAKKAFADEFVRDLPNGYDSVVGERGAMLSGGQRQRIAIARAILRDPTIMIFDEALSQIDSRSEHLIHQAMEEFTKGRTNLLIAHRFSTVLSANRIVVMDKGQIVDIGAHDELLQRCKLYEHLYRTQFLDTRGSDERLG